MNSHGNGLQCPACRCDKLQVVDSRRAGPCIRRRRKCPNCAKRFTTYERFEVDEDERASRSRVVQAIDRLPPFVQGAFQSFVLRLANDFNEDEPKAEAP